MTRSEQFLEVLQPSVLLGVAAVGAILLLLAPRRRLPAAIALSIPWLTAGFLPDLGTAATVAKATSVLPCLMVGLAAARHPGGRSRLPRVAYVYPFVALASVVYTFTVADAAIAMVVQTQWFVMSVAAILVVRTIVDAESLTLVIRGLVAGSAVVVLAALVALLLDPEAVMRGYGRLTPFGVNANHFSVVFPIAIPLTFYLAIRSNTARKRHALEALGVIAVGLAVLAGSRGALVATALSMVPLLFWTLRRRSVAARLLIAAAVLVGLVAIVPLASFDRLYSLDTGRYAITEIYLSEIAERPITGLLLTDGLSAASQQDLGWSPHNSFIYWLYLGGISLAVPMFLVVAATVRASYNLMIRHRLFAVPPLLIQLLFSILIGTYALALSTGMLFYPTNAWAFGHLLISMAVLKLWLVPPRSVVRARARYPQQLQRDVTGAETHRSRI